MTDTQKFRLIVEFEGEITDPEAVRLDQLSTVRSEGKDDVGPFIPDDPIDAVRHAILFRALEHVVEIPGVRFATFPNYVRLPNEDGEYEEYRLPATPSNL